MGRRRDLINTYLRGSAIKSNPKMNPNGGLKMLEYAVKQIYGKKVGLFCIDVEAWERDNRVVTEVGISIYDPEDAMNRDGCFMPSLKTYHLRPKENMHCQNGRYVSDNSQFFAGESTYIMSMADIGEYIRILVHEYFEKRSFCLVGHDLRGDIKWFESIGVSFPPDLARLDTQKFMQLSVERQPSLTNSLTTLEIPHNNLHNAGNDAYYTLLLALKLSDPIARMGLNLDQYPKEVLVSKLKKGGSCQEKVVTLEDLVYYEN